MRFNTFKYIFIILIGIFIFQKSWSQNKENPKEISGVIIEKGTTESIPGVNILIKNTTIGTMSNMDGQFTLKINSYKRSDTVVFSFVGFKDVKIPIRQCKKQMSVKMESATESLAEIVLTPDDTWDEILLRRVIKHKSKNNPRKIKNLDLKEKVQTSVYLSNLTNDFKNAKKFKKSQDAFIKDGDSTFMLPVLVSNENFDNRIIEGKENKMTTFISEESILDNLSDILKNTVDNKLADNFNFYTDVIQIFNKPIPSPISSTYKLYYNVYLVDSLVQDESKKYKFEFYPKSKRAAALKGYFWIDNHDYALNKMYAEIPITANVNFIKKYNIDYTYKKWPGENWYPSKRISDAALVLSKENEKVQKEFRIQKESNYEFNRKLTNIETQKLESINFHLTSTNEKVTKSIQKSDVPSTSEALDGIKVLKQNPFVKTIDKLGSMTLSGYYSAKKIDIGPYFDFFYKNDIEGSRINLPLRTSEQFSKTYSIGGYLGYGFKDEAFKYGLNFNYLFPTEKRLVLKMQYFNDYRAISRNPFKEFIQENPYGQGSGNILTIFQNKDLNPFLLKQQYIHANLEYQITPELQIKARPFYRKFDSNPGNPFINNNKEVNSFQNPGILFDFRYSKDLTYEQAYFNRIYYGAAEPIIHFTAELGQTSIDNPNISNPYAHLNVSFKKIFFMGPVKIKAFFDAGTILGKVPYPLYYNPESVQGIALARYSYNLMNDYALSSTTYSNMHILANGGGIFFNKIPLLNRMKLREAVSFKMFNGRLKKHSGNLFDNHTKVNRPKSEPYMEVGAGISNIFSFLRIEYLYRINKGDFYDSISQRSAIKFRMEVSF